VVLQKTCSHRVTVKSLRETRFEQGNHVSGSSGSVEEVMLAVSQVSPD
jgi:hypothetical protein